MDNQRSPYTTKSIENPSLFFGRENEVSEVIKRIEHSQPLSTILIGGRKIGKTSFVNQLKYLINKKTNDSFTCIPTLMDMQKETISSSLMFFDKLANLTKDNLMVNYDVNIDLIINREMDPYEAFCNNLLIMIDQCAKNIGVIRFVFLIDEADRLLGKAFTEDIFIQLRHLINTSPLSSFVSLVVTGFRELHDYAIMEEKGMGSVLGGDSRWTYLGVLNKTACYKLISEPINEALGTSAIQAVYEQSGGHPYITQYIMDKVWRSNMTSVSAQEVINACSQFEKEAKIFSIWQSKSKELDSYIYELLANKPGDNTLESLRERIQIKVNLGEIKDSLDFLLYTGIVDKHEGCYCTAGELYRRWFLGRNQKYFDEIKSLEPMESIFHVPNLKLIRLVSILIAVLLFIITFFFTKNISPAIFSVFFLWLLSTLVFWLKDIKFKNSTNDVDRIVEINGIVVQSIFDPVIKANQDHKIIIQASQPSNNPIEVVISLRTISPNLGIIGEHSYTFKTTGESKEFIIYLSRRPTLSTLLFPFAEQLLVKFDVIAGRLLKSGYIKLNSDYNLTLVLSGLLSLAGLIAWLIDIGAKIKDLVSP